MIANMTIVKNTIPRIVPNTGIPNVNNAGGIAICGCPRVKPNAKPFRTSDIPSVMTSDGILNF